MSADLPGGRRSVYEFSGRWRSCPSGSVFYAGLNTNRTRETVTVGGTSTVSSFCYDGADRLLAVLGGPSPLAAAQVAYDARGNTTGAGRSDADVGTPPTGTPPPGCRRPAGSCRWRTCVTRPTGSCGARAGGRGRTPTALYSFTGGGDSPDLVLDAGRNLVERQVGLPGGVLVTLRPGAAEPTGTQTWAHPDEHGDVITTSTPSGGRSADPVVFYDAYGQPVDPVTGVLGPTRAGCRTPAPGSWTTGGWGSTSGRWSTPGRWRPSRWAPARTSPRWAGSCRWTPSRAAAPTTTTTQQPTRSTTPTWTAGGAGGAAGLRLMLLESPAAIAAMGLDVPNNGALAPWRPRHVHQEQRTPRLPWC